MNKLIEYKNINECRNIINQMTPEELSISYSLINGDIEKIKKLIREKLFNDMKLAGENKKILITPLPNGNQAKVEIRLGNPEMVKEINTYYNQAAIVDYILRNHIDNCYLECNITKAKNEKWFREMLRKHPNYANDTITEHKKKSNNVIAIKEITNNNKIQELKENNNDLEGDVF